MKPVIIGIAGGTASGKTSIAQILYDTFEENQSVIIIREDDYYKEQPNTTYEERTKTNYDHPFAFDHDLLVEQLIQLMKGNAVLKPTYDFTIHNRSDKVEELKPADVIILEGLFVLENKKIRDLLDIKVFVDTPADERFIRRLQRDIKERARTMESVINQYLNTVKPMHDEFCEPSKKYADIIIPEGKSNTVAIDLLTVKINSILDTKML